MDEKLEELEKMLKGTEEKNDFEVGDVVTDGDCTAVVTRNHSDRDFEKMYVMFPDGSAGKEPKRDWRKTGKQYQQIEEVLMLLQEDEE